jgi:heat shock protein HslJ
MFEVLALAAMLAQAPRAPEPDSAAIEGDWMVEVLDNIDVMAAAPVTLSFRGTRVSGLASCNTYIGVATVTGSSIKTESILTTMKACDGPRMSQERDFLGLLRNAVRFELLADGRLNLVTSDRRVLTARRKSKTDK